MAVTDFGALTAAQKKLWAAKVWKAGRDQSFFFANGFIGTSDADMNSVIQRVTKLSKTERGLQCVMQLVLDLQNDGVVGDNELDGNEEAMINDAQTIRIDQLRHGVKSKGAMAEQATVIRFREQGKDKLAFWMSDKLDELMFLTLSGVSYSNTYNLATRVNSQLPSLTFAGDVVAPSSNRVIYAGTATSTATLTTSNTMNWSLLTQGTALGMTKRLKPIRSGGRNYFCVVISPFQRRDLVNDPTYQTIVSRAEKQGSKNPLFTGALATVDGLVIHSHNKVINTSGLGSGSKWGSGGTVDGAQALMLGAQAGGIATVEDTFWEESDKTDYNNRPGIAVGRMLGMLKPQFLSVYDETSGPGTATRQDFGVISIYSAASITT